MNSYDSEFRIDRKPIDSGYQRTLEYTNYIKQRKFLTNQKIVLKYDNLTLALTEKQAVVLGLVAKGLSNIKIAHELVLKETAVKLIVYRLMKYLESTLFENIDRFYLVIVAQKLKSDNDFYN